MAEGQRQLQKLWQGCCCITVPVYLRGGGDEGVAEGGVRWVTAGVMGVFLMGDLASSPFHLLPLSSIRHSCALLNVMYCCTPREKDYDGLIVPFGN